jgi:hypothetical protein
MRLRPWDDRSSTPEAGAPIADCSCALTPAVGTGISFAGTSRVPASSEKAAVGSARPTAKAARRNLELVIIGVASPWIAREFLIDPCVVPKE